MQCQGPIVFEKFRAVNDLYLRQGCKKWKCTNLVQGDFHDIFQKIMTTVEKQ